MKFLNFFSTFVGHNCPPGSGSGFRIRDRIRIHWPDWIRIRFRIRNTALPPPPNLPSDLCPECPEASESLAGRDRVGESNNGINLFLFIRETEGLRRLQDKMFTYFERRTFFDLAYLKYNQTAKRTTNQSRWKAYRAKTAHGGPNRLQMCQQRFYLGPSTLLIKYSAYQV